MAMKILQKLTILGLFFLSCRPPAHNSSGIVIADSSIRHGRALATMYCRSCHLLPDPLLLDKKTWEKGVMPAMGPRLGIFQYKRTQYPSYKYDPFVGPGAYPSRPLLKDWEWQELMDYYSGMAPDSMPAQPPHKRPLPGQGLFEPEPIGDGYAPVTCFVHIDTAGKRRQVFTGRVFPGILNRYDSGLSPLDSLIVRGGIVDMQVGDTSAIACDIGNLNPNNGRYGAAYKVHFDGGGGMRMDSLPFLWDLARPVQVTGADLNGDGRTDYLVCEFGNLRGALSWMEDNGRGRFIRHVLRAQPGAIKAYIQDVNKDGKPDIWVLFAQGEEGVFLYINKGQGRFEEREVLRFPPVYGSSSFELADINQDGYPDIVYTCGDNADYSVVFKPYHGVYIFLNDGHNRFYRKFFYPINGCYKAVARDFDGDGDLDLAVIAYFADYGRHPEEGFLYFENRGGMVFQPFTVPAARRGRWLTMDAGDVDGDGRVDIVLGNFSIGPALSKDTADWKKGPSALLLKGLRASK
jgi:hypothetical protein